VTREEAAQGLDYHIDGLQDMISQPVYPPEIREVWVHDLLTLVMAQRALRRLDELERWAKAWLEWEEKYGKPVSRSVIGHYLPCGFWRMFLDALCGDMQLPEEMKDGEVE